MFFIPKTVVLALVFQFFRACGAHFLPELFFANAIQFVRSVLYNINSAVDTRKPNVIKSQRLDRSAKSVCACVESAVAARSSNMIKFQRANHTVKRVLCMCRGRNSRLYI